MNSGARTYTDARSVTCRIHGRLDLSLAPMLLGAWQRADVQHRNYVIDLAEVNEMYDSGLALLSALGRRAHRLGHRVRVVNCSPGIAQRCADTDHSGLIVTQTT
ncbi:MAG: hypothetical protein DRQ37_03985 [Gammaproteobacteria bacterium]|nr:MAG: hypothetical protein DRQ37_03985 [Gammaproteobacteria bacterium]